MTTLLGAQNTLTACSLIKLNPLCSSLSIFGVRAKTAMYNIRIIWKHRFIIESFVSEAGVYP